MARIGAGGSARALRGRSPPGSRLHRSSRRSLRQVAGSKKQEEWDLRAPPLCCVNTAASRPRSGMAASQRKRKSCVSIAQSRRWTNWHPAAAQDQTPTWDKAATLARQWELNRLSERLDAFAKQPRRTGERPALLPIGPESSAARTGHATRLKLLKSFAARFSDSHRKPRFSAALRAFSARS
jgi:hypothetical protein